MQRKRAWLGIAPCVAVVTALALTGSAQAASGNFTCRASAARVTALGLVNAEPAVANAASDPCATGSAPGVGLSLPPLLSTGTAAASTTAAASSASSTAEAQNASLTLASALDISAGTAQATASAGCSNGEPSLSGSSQVTGLTIAGRSIAASGSYSLGNIPGGVADVELNEQTITAGTLTRDAVNITIVGGSLNGVHVVLGEAQAGSDGNPCSSATGTGGSPGSGTTGGTGGSTGGTGGTGGSTGGGTDGSNPLGSLSVSCPAGTTAVAGGCEIVAGTEGNARAITVPASDVTGAATVMSLAAARSKYGARTACLNGAGPNYVVIGTKRADHITVRKVRMRVMGLAGNDHITVQGGANTCVNGGAGNDVITNKQGNRVTVFGANGNDNITLGKGPAFVLGGNGKDHIVAGNGKVNLQGNAGNDYLKAGNGPANLNGGNGNDTLVAGTGRAHLNGGPGTNRLTAHGKLAWLMAAKKGKSVAYLRSGNVKYARSHGIVKIHVIKK